MLNTSGIMNFPDDQFEMVRTGIGLYGYGNEAAVDANLKPVGTLKTIIAQINVLEEGETLGYNRVFTATKLTRTATLPIGHADGITRIYGNGKGVVWVNDQPAPIIGNVCMDMIMIDVTDIECREGDEVIIFGGKYSAETFAQGAGTISYEIITAIGPRVPRVIVGA